MKKMPDAKWRYGFHWHTWRKEREPVNIGGTLRTSLPYHLVSDLMEKGFLAKLNVEIVILKHHHRTFSNYNEEIEYLGECDERNEYICKLAGDLKGNVLVLFTRVEGHGIPLYERMSSQTEREVHIIHGGTDVHQRERVREVAETSDSIILFLVLMALCPLELISKIFIMLYLLLLLNHE